MLPKAALTGKRGKARVRKERERERERERGSVKQVTSHAVPLKECYPHKLLNKHTKP